MATLKRKTESGYEVLQTGNKIQVPEYNIVQGITPSGSLSISQNGTYDVTNYASANVNIDGTINQMDGYAGTRSLISASISTSFNNYILACIQQDYSLDSLMHFVYVNSIWSFAYVDANQGRCECLWYDYRYSVFSDVPVSYSTSEEGFIISSEAMNILQNYYGCNGFNNAAYRIIYW